MVDALWHVLLLLAWIALWLALHLAAGLLVSRICLAGPLPAAKAVWCRKLLRSQVYYIAAAFSGICLIISLGFPWKSFFLVDAAAEPSPIRTMLLGSSSDTALAVAAAAAAAHWLLAMVEDWLSKEYLLVQWRPSQSESLLPPMTPNATTLRRATTTMRYVYLAHHALAAVAFCWTLFTSELGALCCFGLLFELPVCLTNLRDFYVSFHEELTALMGRSVMVSPRFARLWWRATAVAVGFGRCPALLAFAWARGFWTEELARLPAAVSGGFAVFGTGFSLLTLLWCVQLFADCSNDCMVLRRPP